MLELWLFMIVLVSLFHLICNTLWRIKDHQNWKATNLFHNRLIKIQEDYNRMQRDAHNTAMANQQIQHEHLIKAIDEGKIQVINPS